MAERGDFEEDFSTDEEIEKQGEEDPSKLWEVEHVLESQGTGERQEVQFATPNADRRRARRCYVKLPFSKEAQNVKMLCSGRPVWSWTLSLEWAGDITQFGHVHCEVVL